VARTARAKAKETASATLAGEMAISPGNARRPHPSARSLSSASAATAEGTPAHNAQQRTFTSRVKGKEQEGKVGTVARAGEANPAERDGEAKAKEEKVTVGARAKERDPVKEFTDWT
jgi:hypothetical protein